MVPLNSETLCLSEATEVLNKTPYKFLSQFILQYNHIFKLPTPFEEHLIRLVLTEEPKQKT